MAQNTNSLSKQYYSVTPIQDLPAITNEDLPVMASDENGGGYLPVGKKSNKISNKISVRQLQSLIDTKPPEEAVAKESAEDSTGGLISGNDIYVLHKYLIDNTSSDKQSLEYLITNKDNLTQLINNKDKLGLANLKDGQNEGSLRTSLSSEENTNYILGRGSFTEGLNTKAIGNNSHASGEGTIANNNNETVIGQYNATETESSLFVVGNGTNSSNRSNAFIVNSNGDTIVSNNLTVLGEPTENNHVITKQYFMENKTGLQNLIDGTALNSVQGIAATASGQYSFAEGEGTIASGFASHAEGGRSYATNTNSHAEGDSCNATGHASHAEGNSCDAIGDYSHAEGLMTEARGESSHTSGKGTIANNNNEFVIGSYNNFQHIEKETENIQTILIDINNMSQSYTLLQTPVEDTQIICNFYCLNDQNELVQPYQISFTVGRADGDQHNWLSGTYDGDQTFVFEWSGTEEELLNTKLKIKGVSIKYNVISQQDNNIFVIGNGTDNSHRSNLFTIEKDTGNIWTPGNITSNNIITPSATIDTITTNNLNIGQGVNIIDKIFPVGSIYGCSPDLDPNNFLNGTWQITNKYLKRVWYSTSSADGKISNGTQIMQWATNVVDTNKTIGFVANPQGTLLQLRSVFTLKTAYQDTAAKDDMVVWTLYGDKIGLKLSDEALHQVYCIGASDGMNAIVYATLVWSVTDGNKPRAQLRIQDMITRSATIPSSTYSIGFSINYQIPQEHIEDSFCDKIEWTRIS